MPKPKRVTVKIDGRVGHKQFEGRKRARTMRRCLGPGPEHMFPSTGNWERVCPRCKAELSRLPVINEPLDFA